MSIEDGNKLIAEFLGCQVDRDSATMHVWIHGDEPTFFYCEWHPELKLENERVIAWEFEPNKNWCQLMPVVEKIGKLSPYIIHERGMRISDAGITYKSAISTIDGVWQAVVLYIKWYNQKQSQ